MKRSLCLLLGLVLSLSASASARDPLNPPPPKLPYDRWYIGMLASNYMEVWVESVDVLDRRGLAVDDAIWFGGLPLAPEWL
ncbi:MAG: hypothetical protein ACK4VV_12520 [Pseudomonas sp.]